MASAPPLVKNTCENREPGARSTMSRAASERAAFACCGATVASVTACSWMARTIAGCPKPRFVKTSWPEKSRYVVPSPSQTHEPCPPATTSGVSAAWADQEWKTCARSSSYVRRAASGSAAGCGAVAGAEISGRVLVMRVTIGGAGREAEGLDVLSHTAALPVSCGGGPVRLPVSDGHEEDRVKYVFLIYQGTTPLPGAPEWDAFSPEEQKAVYDEYAA